MPHRAIGAACLLYALRHVCQKFVVQANAAGSAGRCSSQAGGAEVSKSSEAAEEFVCKCCSSGVREVPDRLRHWALLED